MGRASHDERNGAGLRRISAGELLRNGGWSFSVSGAVGEIGVQGDGRGGAERGEAEAVRVERGVERGLVGDRRRDDPRTESSGDRGRDESPGVADAQDGGEHA